MFALFLKFRVRTRPQDLWPFFILETGLKFLIWTQGEIGPGNRAHVKRPSEALVVCWVRVNDAHGKSARGLYY